MDDTLWYVVFSNIGYSFTHSQEKNFNVLEHQRTRTQVSAISGLIIGLGIVGETSLLGNSTIPRWLANFCSKWFLPLLLTSPSRSTNSRRMRTPASRPTRAAVTRSTAVDTPREEDIQSLMSLATTMGLGRDDVMEALRVTNNRVQEAANLLLARSTQ